MRVAYALNDSPPPRPRSPAVLVVRDAKTTTTAISLGQHPSLQQIAVALGGAQHIVCHTRADGAMSAYCLARPGAEPENAAAAAVAQACGISIPAEALPLRGPVLFLGPADSLDCRRRQIVGKCKP